MTSTMADMLAQLVQGIVGILGSVLFTLSIRINRLTLAPSLVSLYKIHTSGNKFQQKQGIKSNQYELCLVSNNLSSNKLNSKACQRY